MTERKRLGIREMAERYGVTEQAVRMWIGKAPIWKEGHRRYGWSDEMDAWRSSHGREAPPQYYSAEDQQAIRATLSEEKTRLAKEQADNMELRNRIARGELLQSSKVKEAASSLFAAVSSRLRQIGVRLAPALAVESEIKRCRDLVEQAVEDAILELRDLAAVVGNAGASSGTPGRSDATTEANPKRVGRSASPAVTRGVR